MELGRKLKQARLEAGMSQRALCGEEITRNMLSLIENGGAQPSMKTLQYLAGRLGKSVSYFLEDGTVSENGAAMERARQCWDSGSWAQCLEELACFRGPDPVFDRERQLLEAMCRLELARQALEEGRGPYARQLLEQTDCAGLYCAQALQRQKLLLLGRLPGQSVSHLLPSLNEELCLRAEEALAEGEFHRAGCLLDAMECREDPRWQLLRGRCLMGQKAYASAAEHLHRAEEAWPRETAPLLEICCRELGDYRMAYEYACRQR